MATHSPIPVLGYGEQSTEKIERVNENKLLEEQVLRQIDKMAAEPFTDMRWLAVGRTHIEQGFMAINRAVFQPGRITLPGDKEPTP